MNSLLRAYRQKVPNDSRSDEELMLSFGAAHEKDGRYSKFTDFVEEYNAMVTAAAAEEEPPSVPMKAEFRRGFTRGVEGLKASAYGMGALAADAVGAEDFKKAMLDRYMATEERIQDARSGVEKVEDIDSVGKGVSWALGKAGELVPMVGEAVVGAGVGALAGSAVAPGAGTAAGGAAGAIDAFVGRQALKSVIKALAGKQAAKIIPDAAARAAVRGELTALATEGATAPALSEAAKALLTTEAKALARKYGANTANVLNFYALGAGGMYPVLDANENVSDTGAQAGAAIAGLGNAAGALFPASVVSKLFPGVADDVAQTYLRRLAINAGDHIPNALAGMGLMEVANIGAERYADPTRRDQPLTKEELSRILNASAVGLLAGGVTSVATALRRPPQKFDPIIEEKLGGLTDERRQQLAELKDRIQSKTASEADMASFKTLSPEESAFIGLAEPAPTPETGLPKGDPDIKVNQEASPFTRSVDELEAFASRILEGLPEEAMEAEGLNKADQLFVIGRVKKLRHMMETVNNPPDILKPREQQKQGEQADATTPPANQEALRKAASLSLANAEDPLVQQARAKLEAARSQTNTAPTAEEKVTGRYQKGEAELDGLKLHIENPKDSERSGIGPDGKPWSVRMPGDYGYILGTKGKDKEIDITVGPDPTKPTVFVIDQIDPKTGKFDEHKTFYGYESQVQAEAAYDASFSDGSGPSRRGAVTAMDKDTFKQWLKGDTTKAVKYVEPKARDVGTSVIAKDNPDIDLDFAERLRAHLDSGKPLAFSTHGDGTVRVGYDVGVSALAKVELTPEERKAFTRASADAELAVSPEEKSQAFRRQSEILRPAAERLLSGEAKPAETTPTKPNEKLATEPTEQRTEAPSELAEGPAGEVREAAAEGTGGVPPKGNGPERVEIVTDEVILRTLERNETPQQRKDRERIEKTQAEFADLLDEFNAIGSEPDMTKLHLKLNPLSYVGLDLEGLNVTAQHVVVLTKIAAKALELGAYKFIQFAHKMTDVLGRKWAGIVPVTYEEVRNYYEGLVAAAEKDIMWPEGWTRADKDKWISERSKEIAEAKAILKKMTPRSKVADAISEWGERMQADEGREVYPVDHVVTVADIDFNSRGVVDRSAKGRDSELAARLWEEARKKHAADVKAFKEKTGKPPPKVKPEMPQLASTSTKDTLVGLLVGFKDVTRPKLDANKKPIRGEYERLRGRVVEDNSGMFMLHKRGKGEFRRSGMLKVELLDKDGKPTKEVRSVDANETSILSSRATSGDAPVWEAVAQNGFWHHDAHLKSWAELGEKLPNGDPKYLWGQQQRDLFIESLSWVDQQAIREQEAQLVEPAWFRPERERFDVLAKRLLSDSSPKDSGARNTMTHRVVDIIDTESKKVHRVSVWENNHAKGAKPKEYTWITRFNEVFGRKQDKAARLWDLLQAKNSEGQQRFRIIGSARTKGLTEYYHAEFKNRDIYRDSFLKEAERQQAEVQGRAAAVESNLEQAGIEQGAAAKAKVEDAKAKAQEEIVGKAPVSEDELRELGFAEDKGESRDRTRASERVAEDVRDPDADLAQRAAEQEAAAVEMESERAKHVIREETVKPGETWEKVEERIRDQMEKGGEDPADFELVRRDLDGERSIEITLRREERPLNLATEDIDALYKLPKFDTVGDLFDMINTPAITPELFSVIRRIAARNVKFFGAVERVGLDKALKEYGYGNEVNARTSGKVEQVPGREAPAGVPDSEQRVGGRPAGPETAVEGGQDRAGKPGSKGDEGNQVAPATDAELADLAKRKAEAAARLEKAKQEAAEAEAKAAADLEAHRAKSKKEQEALDFWSAESGFDTSTSIDLLRNPDGWGEMGGREVVPVSPEDVARLDSIIRAAADAGIDIRLVRGELGRGLYQPPHRRIWLEVTTALGRREIVTVLHEIGHDVFVNLPPEVRARLIEAVKSLSDGAMGLEMVADRRIRADNPGGLAPDLLAHERLVESTALRLAKKGFNPEEARGYAQQFARAFKDITIRGALAVQRMLGFKENARLAQKYFENKVEMLLAGDRRQVSYPEFVGAVTPPLDQRMRLYFGKETIDHVPALSNGAVKFNLDAAIAEALEKKGLLRNPDADSPEPKVIAKHPLLADASIDGRKAKHVMKDLVREGLLDWSPTMKELVRQINERFSDEVEIRVVDEADLPQRIQGKAPAAFFTPGRNSDLPRGVYLIKGSWNRFNRWGGPDQTATRILVHEYVHALTAEFIDRNPDSPLVKQLQALMDASYNKWLNSPSAKTGKRHYGFANELEFIAEVFSNPRLQAELKSQRAPKWAITEKVSTVWDAVVSIIRQITGAKRGSAIEEVLKTSMAIMERADAERRSAEPMKIREPRGHERLPSLENLIPADEVGEYSPKVAVERKIAVWNHLRKLLDNSAKVLLESPALKKAIEEAEITPQKFLDGILNVPDIAAQVEKFAKEHPEIDINTAADLKDFKHQAQKDYILANTYRDMQAYISRIGRQRGKSQEALEELGGRLEKLQEKMDDAQEYLDWKGKTTEARKAFAKEFGGMRQRLQNAFYRKGVIEQQLSALDPTAKLKEYMPVFEQLFTGKELQGEPLWNLLDTLANDKRIDFSKSAEQIRDDLVLAVADGAPYQKLLGKTKTANALLATVIGFAKTHAKDMAEIELRRAEGTERAQIEEQVKADRYNQREFGKELRDLARTAKLEERYRAAYAKAKRELNHVEKQITKHQQKIDALDRVFPFFAKRQAELASELAIGADATWGDGMRFAVPERPDISSKDLLKKLADARSRAEAAGADDVDGIGRIRLDSSDKVTDPAQLEAQLKQMADFLAHRDARFKAGELDAQDNVYHSIKRAFDEISQHKVYRAQRGPAERLMAELHLMPVGRAIAEGFGTPVARMIDQAINKFVTVQQSMRQEVIRIGRENDRIENRLMELMPSLERNRDLLRERILNPIKGMLKRQHDLEEMYANDPEALRKALFTRVRKELLSRKDTAQHIGKNIDKAMPIIRELIEFQHNANKMNLQKVMEAGTGVKDPNRMALNPVTGVSEPGVRRHLAIGAYTFPQKLHREFNLMVHALQNSDWQSLEDRLSKTVGDEKVTLADVYEKQGAEAAYAMVKDMFEHPDHYDSVTNTFFGELAKMDTESPFDAPVLEDGETRPPANTTYAKEAFELSKGNPVKFAEFMYDLHGGAKDPKAKGQYVMETLQRLDKLHKEVVSMYSQYEAGPGAMTVRGILGMTPDALIDARTVDHLPGSWFDYHSFDRRDMIRMADRIASQTAFGRKQARLAGMFETLKAEIAEAQTRLDEAWKTVRNENPLLPEKQQEVLVAKRLGPEEYKILKAQSERAKLWSDAVNGLSDFFRKDNHPDISLSVAVRAAQTLGNMLVNNPSSAIYQLAALFDINTRYGAAPSVTKSTMSTVKLAGKEIAHSLAEAIGIQWKNESEKHRLYVHLGLNDAGAVARFKDAFDRLEGESGRAAFFRGINDVLGTGINRMGKKAEHTVLRPMQPFISSAILANKALTIAMWNHVETHVMKAMEFYKAHPEKLADVGHKVDASTLKLKGYEKDSFGRLVADLEGFGLDIDTMARDSIKRNDGKAFTDQEALRIYTLTMSKVSSEGSIATMPLESYNSSTWRLITPLLGWSFRRMMQVGSMRLTPEGRHSMDALARGMVGLGVATVGGLGVAAIVQQYYEKVVGKQRNIRPVIGTSSPQEFALGLLENMNRIGTVGFFGELANTAVNVTTGGDNRALSVDQRVIAMSAIQSILGAASAWINQGEADYARVIRPVAQAMGAGGMLQYMQIANRMFGFDNAESRMTARMNASNYLRVVGRQLDLDVRPMGKGGYGAPTPISPSLTRMELSALANDTAGFQAAYRQAVERAKDAEYPDPVDHVKRAYAARNPLRTVFRTPPTNAEYQRLLQQLPGDGRRDVEEAINLFNSFAESIGARGFEGKKEKDTAKTTAPTFRLSNPDAFRMKALESLVGN